MRRLAALLFVVGFAAGCSDQKMDQPMSPYSPVSPQSAITAGTVADSLAIESLLRQLYLGLNGGDGPYNSAQTRWQQIARLFTNCTLNPPQSPCDAAGAKSNTYMLATDILSRYKSGGLNNLTSYRSPSGTGTAAAVTDLVNLLLRYVGIDGSICSFATDCNSTIYQPGSPAQTLITPSGQAGISLPPGTGTVTQPTIISVSRIVDPSVRLTTQLDQYTYRYFYTSTSGEGVFPDTPFGQFVTVQVCLEPGQTFPPGGESRLALAHDIAEPAPYENIQILPPAPGFLTTCGTLGMQNAWWGDALASLILPRPLQASVLVATGTSGQTKNLSPFGAVDTLGFITASSPVTGNAPEGGTVTAPSVRVVSPSELQANNPNGPGMAGIPVTFTITAGGGCFDTSCTSSSPTTLTVNTDAKGYASVPAWSVGVGSNTVTAAAAIPCSAPVAPDAFTNCGTIVTPELASKLTFSATGNPPTRLGFSVQPVTTTAGTSFGVTVVAQDAFGNTVPAYSSPKYASGVALALNAANGATLSGTTLVNASGGVATFSGLSVTKAGTNYTITASASGLTSGVSNSFSILAGPASAIAIQAGNNQTAVEGSTLGVTSGTTAPAVRVSDAYNNPVAGAGITFAVASGAGLASPLSATTDGLGIASTNWTIVAGSNTLNANITALGPLPMVSFTATGTSATTVLVSCAPANGNGDELNRAFYINKLGKTLKQVTLYLASNDPANVPTQYSIQLLASAESYGATPFASSTVSPILNGASSQNLATNFVFPNVAIPNGTKNVAFQFRVLSNPNNAKLYFALSNASCTQVTETSGTTPLPLGTALRKGVGIKVLGN
jgi:hypothetical protein